MVPSLSERVNAHPITKGPQGNLRAFLLVPVRAQRIDQYQPRQHHTGTSHSPTAATFQDQIITLIVDDVLRPPPGRNALQVDRIPGSGLFL